MTRFSKKNPCINAKYKRFLKNLLGFKPKDINLYILAFTHKSSDLNDCLEDSSLNNERLEYLGDAILDAVISDLLYKRFPTADEGFLTQMRTKIVNGKKLAELSHKLNINKLMLVKSEKNLSERIYEDAFEALIGAIYIDRGFKYAKRFVFQKIMVEHIDLNKLKYIDTNFKSKIIEWSQKHKINIDFCTNAVSENSKEFLCELKISDKVIGKGKAFSKKTAEQFASKDGLEKIKNGFFNLVI